MGFKMNGSPAKTGTISGTAGHSSALKMKAEENAASALKQMTITKEDMKGSGYSPGDPSGEYTVSATGSTRTSGDKKSQVKLDPSKKGDKAVLEARWKKGDKASGGTLNELVAARKGHKKGSAEYAEIQNKINKSLGSKKVHKGTKVNKKGKTVETKPKGTTTRKADGATVVKGLGAQKGNTLTYTDKAAEKVKIAKEKTDIKEAKVSGDKKEKLESQKEISEIKSGRDNAKTGTKISRWWHKGRAKRKGKKLAE